MLAAQGAFKQSIPVVTVYTNLGEDAVRHSIEVCTSSATDLYILFIGEKRN
jgi:hypothetical protein